MNGHISETRTGNTTDKFDMHMIKCRDVHKITNEPYFEIRAFMKLSKEELLIPYESHLHSLEFDIMNR